MAERLNMTAPQRVVFYCGGFAPIGGIESFASELLLAIKGAVKQRHLVAWGAPPAHNPLLRQVIADGVEITHSRFRWGCRWRIPDRLLLPRGIPAVQKADLVVFSKLFSREIHVRLRHAARAKGRNCPFVFVTPYPPREYFGPPECVDILPTFDAIIVQTAGFKSELLELGYEGRIEIIPLIPRALMASRECQPRKSGRHVRIGYLGRLEPQKNLHYLLKVFQALCRRSAGANSNHSLHLYGDGSLRESLVAEARDLGIAHCVSFEGPVYGDEVVNAIDSCDVFVMTSLSEGQCLSALEVLGRGRPLVTSPVGALCCVIDSPALGALAPLNNPEEFARVLSDTIDALKSGRISPETVQSCYAKKYNRDVIISNYLSLFSDLIKN